MPRMKFPYTEECRADAHRPSATGEACETCRARAQLEARRASGQMPPLQFPYLPTCRAAGHKASSTGLACMTCQHRPTPEPTDWENAAPTWWVNEIVDALIMLQHSRISLSDEYLISLIERAPR